MKPATRYHKAIARGLPPGLFIAALLIACGCGPPDRGATSSPRPSVADPSNAPVASAVVDGGAWTEARGHAALREHNPGYNGQAVFRVDQGRITVLQLSDTGVTNLAPLALMPLQALDLSRTRVSNLEALRGLPLRELYLEQCPVEDLSPLESMPLLKLYLSQTPVRDLSPLRNMPLVELNLLGTRVTDLRPLKNTPLQMLWLNETPVSDIAPLGSCPLISLTLHRSQVRDLSPLAGGGLERLHIGETPVTDLTPLKGLRLTRLVFSPERITQGLEIARAMPTLREVGVTLETIMPPSQFWSAPDSSLPGQP